MKSPESLLTTSAPRHHRARAAGTLAVGLAVAILGGACGPRTVEGASPMPATTSAQPEALPSTAAATAPAETQPSKYVFPAAVQEALKKAAAGTTCKLVDAQDHTYSSGGEGTVSDVVNSVSLSFTYKHTKDTAKVPYPTSGALAGFATGTQDGQERKNTPVALQGGVTAPVPIDPGQQQGQENAFPEGNWSEGSRISFIYTGMAGREVASNALLASSSALCAGSLTYTNGKWIYAQTPAGHPAPAELLQCGADGQPLLACDPSYALRYQ